MARYIPHKITFCAYAENEEQVKQLQDALNDFVRQQYNRGAIVTTSKLLQALQKFGNNLFITNFLKQ
jgi:hypothetical protein